MLVLEMLGDLDSVRTHGCIPGDLNPIHDARLLFRYVPFSSPPVLHHELLFVVMGTLWTLQSSHPGLSLYSKEPLAFGTAYYAISLGTNIVLTALIVARLLVYRRAHLAQLGTEHTREYLSAATLIIESAALYSAFAIAFLVSYALNNPINQIWLGFAQAAQVLCLCILRKFFDDTNECSYFGSVASRNVPHHLPCRRRDCLDPQDCDNTRRYEHAVPGRRQREADGRRYRNDRRAYHGFLPCRYRQCGWSRGCPRKGISMRKNY